MMHTFQSFIQIPYKQCIQVVMWEQRQGCVLGWEGRCTEGEHWNWIVAFGHVSSGCLLMFIFNFFFHPLLRIYCHYQTVLMGLTFTHPGLNNEASNGKGSLPGQWRKTEGQYEVRAKGRAINGGFSLGGVSHLQNPYNESQSQFEEGSLGLHLSLGTLETVLC